MKFDYDEIAKLERAIEKRWGRFAVENPKAWWSTDKEEVYLEQLKQLSKKQNTKPTKKEVDGVLIETKLLNRERKLYCPVCDSKLLTVKDDIYMNKFSCCEKCFVKYVEDREERWLEGWRPDNVTEDS